MQSCAFGHKALALRARAGWRWDHIWTIQKIGTEHQRGPGRILTQNESWAGVCRISI